MSEVQETRQLAPYFAHMRDAWDTAVQNRYRMSKVDRFRPRLDIYPEGVAADHNVESEVDYFMMVERARHLDREDIIAGAVVDRLVNNVLQNGFNPTPLTGNDRIDRYIKVRWDDYANTETACDFQREHSFNQLARFTLRDTIVAGDMLVLPLASGQVQLIENHRLKTPANLTQAERDMTVFGVQLDGGRRRVAYYVTRDDVELGRFVPLADTVRVPAFNRFGQRMVLHVFHPKRSTETRGITKFAAIHSGCAMHDDVQFAKLVQQQSVSCWTMVRERQLGFELPPDYQEPIRQQSDPGAPGELRQIRNLNAGMMYTGLPGETLRAFASNVPNPTFFDHAKQIQQLVAINLGIPLVLLLLDASETNYSGWRGALEQAKIQFRQFQSWFAGEFHRPLYLWKLVQWSDPRSPLADPVLVRSRGARLNVFNHEWVYPTWDTTEPLKDSTDRLLRTSNNLSSLRRVHAEVGQHFQTEIQHLIDDRALAVELAINKAAELNKKYPDNEHPVTWMQLAGASLPEGLSLNLQADLTGEEEQPTPATQPRSTSRNGNRS